MSITVFIVDDHALVRDALAQVLRLEADLAVVGQGDGTEASLAAIARDRPAVVLVDLEMPHIRGADFIGLTKHRSPSSHVLVCSMHSSRGYVTEALRQGADGYVLKSSPSSRLIEAIRAVAAGHGTLDPELQTDVIRFLKGGDQHGVGSALSAAEIEVLRMAADGQGNHEIASQTGQSLETVKLRLRRSFQKLGATDRANAVALALRRNLL